MLAFFPRPLLVRSKFPIPIPKRNDEHPRHFLCEGPLRDVAKEIGSWFVTQPGSAKIYFLMMLYTLRRARMMSRKVIFVVSKMMAQISMMHVKCLQQQLTI